MIITVTYPRVLKALLDLHTTSRQRDSRVERWPTLLSGIPICMTNRLSNSSRGA
jgi:hypothetical protein